MWFWSHLLLYWVDLLSCGPVIVQLIQRNITVCNIGICALPVGQAVKIYRTAINMKSKLWVGLKSVYEDIVWIEFE